jgi:peroxiredoxin
LRFWLHRICKVFLSNAIFLARYILSSLSQTAESQNLRWFLRVDYVAIGRDDKAEVQEFLNKTPWKFQQISDGTSLIQERFKVQWGFPTTFLLNKDAEIILAFSGGKTDASAATAIQEKLIPDIKKALK